MKQLIESTVKNIQNIGLNFFHSKNVNTLTVTKLKHR